MSGEYSIGKTALKTTVPAIIVIGVAKFIETVSDGKITTEMQLVAKNGALR